MKFYLDNITVTLKAELYDVAFEADSMEEAEEIARELENCTPFSADRLSEKAQKLYVKICDEADDAAEPEEIEFWGTVLPDGDPAVERCDSPGQQKLFEDGGGDGH